MRGSVKFTLELFLIAKFRVLTVGLVHHTQTLDLLLTWYKVYLYLYIIFIYTRNAGHHDNRTTRQKAA